MTRHLIVQRASPDWLRFDPEDSRLFLRRLNLPESLIVDFVALWDRTFKLDYRTVRAALKSLSEETCRAVRGADFVMLDRWDEAATPSAAWIAFVDDDDWMAPDIFDRLGGPEGHDGARWGNIRVGRSFQPNAPIQDLIQRRPLNATIYTNNYLVTGAALARHGRAALFEHASAQAVLNAPGFRLLVSDAYLSCAVKHPCCTLSARFLMADPRFVADPGSEIDTYLVALADAKVSDTWLTQPFARFRALMTDALAPRRP